jgi:hypothetical protein
VLWFVKVLGGSDSEVVDRLRFEEQLAFNDPMSEEMVLLSEST